MIGLWFAKRKLRKQLQGCNYEMAKAMLIRKFSNDVIPNELAHLFDKFVANPGFDTAFNLEFPAACSGDGPRDRTLPYYRRNKVEPT